MYRIKIAQLQAMCVFVCVKLCVKLYFKSFNKLVFRFERKCFL